MKKKATKVILIVLAIVLVVLFFAPTIAKNYIVNNSKELIGAKVTIDKLKYNYFTSTIKLYDFKLYEQNDVDKFVGLDTLILNLEPLKLISDKIEIEQFYVKGLYVKTILKDSTFNFDELIAYHTSKDTVAEEDEDPSPLKYSISNIDFKDSNVIFDNQDVGSVTDLKNLSFSIPYIGWDQEQKSSADVKFNFENGGYFSSSLNINPVNGEFDADIVVNNLVLEPFYEYVLPYADINSFNGLLNSKIHIVGNTNEAVNSIVSGQVDVSDFIMTDKSDKKVLGSDFISCSLKKIDYANESYVLDSLNFEKPYIYFQMDSTSNNMLELFKPYFDSEEQSVSSDSINTDSTSELYYAINHLNVKKGILDYTDNLTGEKFDYHLSEIKIQSDSIFSDSKWIDIQSDMLLNKRGTLDANLGFDPNDFMNSTLSFRIENFLLSDINIYSNYYTGHNVLEGDFFYYSNSKIVDGKIASENKLLIKNVAVTNDKKGLNSLPLKFALFLLKDKNGDVNLDIPVRGDLNDPKVNIGKLVWSTFKNLIGKVVASPINFLAGLVDGNPKEMEQIDYSYLQTEPTDKNKKQLNKLIDLEKKKDGLQINMVYLVDNDQQKEVIALDEAGKMFKKDTNKDYLKDRAEFDAYLKKKVGVDSLSVNQAVGILTKDIKLDSLSNFYNQSRLNSTMNYLKSVNDFTQIKIIESDSILPKSPDNYPFFKMEYKMKEE